MFLIENEILWFVYMGRCDSGTDGVCEKREEQRRKACALQRLTFMKKKQKKRREKAQFVTN